ncbi:MAG TPA: hypothetical protein VFR25_06270 [Candidatus Eisenbacteria bacterium]|nr:hypothetical protein [Candidatus Eisenbacteria bacterium]
MGHFRTLAVPAALLFALVLPGCNDEDKILVENQPAPNNPPLIVSYGPESPVENLAYFGPIGVDLWALTGDPDGLDDVSAVALHIDSIQLNQFIARPDTSTTGCIQIGYAQTVDTAPILAVPATFPGIEFLAMRRTQGGLFTANGLGELYGAIDLEAASPVLEDLGGYCGGNFHYVQGPMRAVPPGVPQVTTIVVTYMDVVYNGLKITVYDKVGASAVATVPAFHVVFVTPEERELITAEPAG